MSPDEGLQLSEEWGDTLRMPFLRLLFSEGCDLKRFNYARRAYLWGSCSLLYRLVCFLRIKCLSWSQSHTYELATI